MRYRGEQAQTETLVATQRDIAVTRMQSADTMPARNRASQMDMRVFWSVLGALVAFGVLVLVVAGLRERAIERQQAEAWNAVMKAARDPDPMGLRALAAKRHAAEEAARARDLARRQLRSNERCVGGTVITVEGASYTQALGPDARPVACSGQYRR